MKTIPVVISTLKKNNHPAGVIPGHFSNQIKKKTNMKDQLKQARKAANLRQIQLAKIANVGIATIIRAETTNVKLSTYKKIFDALALHNQNNSLN